MPKNRAGSILKKGVYSEELNSSVECCAVELSQLSEVSEPGPSRPDTVFGLTPSLFIRVTNAVRC
jgi:hypothetical protein